MIAPSASLFVGRDTELARALDGLAQVGVATIYGVAGSGKTRLLTAVGEQLSASGHRVLFHGCAHGERPAAVVASLAAQLTDDGSLGPDEALLRAAREQRTVVCLDDAHLLADDGGLEVLLAQRRRAPLLWLIGARRVLLSPLTTDHCRIHLGPLGAEPSRELWERLAALYGPTSGELPSGAAATPMAVRVAFLRGAVGALRIDAAPNSVIHDATPPELECLRVLSRLRRPVDLATLIAATGADPALIRELERRFLLHTTATGAVEIDEIARTACDNVIDGHAGALRVCERLLERKLPGALEEVAFHAAFVDPSRSLALLEGVADDLGSYVPFIEAFDEPRLVQAIETLAAQEVEVPESVTLLRLRLLARQGSADTAIHDLARLPDSGSPARALTSGVVHHLRGRFGIALEGLRVAARAEALTPAQRVFAMALAIDAMRAEANIDITEPLLEQLTGDRSELGVIAIAFRRTLHAALGFDGQDFGQAIHALGEAANAFESVGITTKTTPLFAAFRAWARAATSDAAADARDAIGPTSSTYVRIIAAIADAERFVWIGQTTRAIEVARDARLRAIALSFGGLARWASRVEIEALAAAGRCEESIALAEAFLGDAELCAHAARTRVRIVELLSWARIERGQVELSVELAEAVLPQLGYVPRVEGRAAYVLTIGRGLLERQTAPSVTTRSRAPLECALIEAEQALCTDDGPTEAHVLALEAALRSERTSMHTRVLAWCVLAEARYATGDVPGATLAAEEVSACALQYGMTHHAHRAQLLMLAIERAATGAAPRERLTDLAGRMSSAGHHGLRDVVLAMLHADSGLAPRRSGPAARYCRRLGIDGGARLRITASHDARRFLSGTDLSRARRRCDTVLDFVSQTFDLATVRHDMHARPAMSSLVLAIARNQGTPLSMAEIFSALYGGEYHPLRHRSRLSTAIMRARRLLGTELLHGDDHGVRLNLPGRWIIVWP